MEFYHIGLPNAFYNIFFSYCYTYIDFDSQDSNVGRNIVYTIGVSCSTFFYILGISSVLLPIIVKRIFCLRQNIEDKDIAYPVYEDIGQDFKSKQQSVIIRMDDNTAYGQRY